MADEPICKKCGSRFFWESIYLDGIQRCEFCEQPPSPDMIGRWVGPAAELLQQVDRGEAKGEHERYEPGTDPAERFVEYLTADGRQGLTLRGYDNPKHVNYNQRTCAYVAIGTEAYERAISELQTEWRAEIMQ